MFMKFWIELESLIRESVPPQRGARAIIPSAGQLISMNLLTEDTAYDFEQLRRMRNLLVYGVELPSVRDLDDATKRLRVILAAIKRRLDDQGEDGEGVPA
jgi:hypothetical protein